MIHCRNEVIKVHDDDARKARKEAAERFANAQRLEREYLRSLRVLARQVGHIVKAMAPDGIVEDSFELENTLRNYAKAIEPWAQAIAKKMLARIEKRDATSWMRLGRSIGKSLREELDDAPVGDELRRFMREQVILITNLPIEAADRINRITSEELQEAHAITLKGITRGARSKELAQEVLRTGEFTLSRATLIARTEIARTASGLTMARAQSVGSTHYIWRTARDHDVRPSHHAMDKQVCEWANPPEVEPGKHYHAGMIYNCRCYPEPILIKE